MKSDVAYFAYSRTPEVVFSFALGQFSFLRSLPNFQRAVIQETLHHVFIVCQIRGLMPASETTAIEVPSRIPKQTSVAMSKVKTQTLCFCLLKCLPRSPSSCSPHFQNPARSSLRASAHLSSATFRRPPCRCQPRFSNPPNASTCYACRRSKTKVWVRNFPSSGNLSPALPVWKKPNCRR